MMKKKMKEEPQAEAAKEEQREAPAPALPPAPSPAPELVISNETLESFADDVGSLWVQRRIPVLKEPPSSLDFLRDYVSCSRPCIIQNALLSSLDDDNSGQHRPPLLLSLDDLVSRMKGVDVKLHVNATPDGHGDCLRKVTVPTASTTDASTTTDDDKSSETVVHMFVEPENRIMSIPEFRDQLRAKQKTVQNVTERIFSSFVLDTDDNDSGNDDHYEQQQTTGDENDSSDAVLYYSRQNDCLRAELSPLWDSGLFPTSFDWAEQAFGVGPPDAVNLWIGNELSVSSMHKDHYENLFYVLSGIKVFTICPPADAPFLYERECSSGSFSTRRNSTDDSTDDDDGDCWRVQRHVQEADQSSSVEVRWIAANVHDKSNNDPGQVDDKDCEYPLLRYTHPITITVREGEMLYLPALWFHSVTQTTETVAMNYWYDMKFDSPAWCYFHLLQQLQLQGPCEKS